jgi:hypothetical protein
MPCPYGTIRVPGIGFNSDDLNIIIILDHQALWR